ncbi:hypothetical protein BZM27_06680 [Paraburkholderia steynii]|uniref:Uncharacterized protein n=1 Tax=Paraburkholderia steynii TaxID=1245441 RepID=A0A4R0XFE7_9BURK|nr:hypothetical protein BZM27_06680 [Paraburkholderia steynii]
MGWLFSHGQTRAQLIARITRNEEHDDCARRCLRHCSSGNVLWTVWEIERPGDTPLRYIGCDLLAWDKGCAGWGYKDLCEEMEPFYYSCPLAYLEIVPPASPAWREKVRAWHAARSRVLTPGDMLTLKGLSITEAVVVSQRHRTWIVESGGQLFLFPPRLFHHIVQQRRSSEPARQPTS